jgi:hypothetical protein
MIVMPQGVPYAILTDHLEVGVIFAKPAIHDLAHSDPTLV